MTTAVLPDELAPTAGSSDWTVTQGNPVTESTIYGSGDGVRVGAGRRNREAQARHREALLRTLDLVQAVMEGDAWAALAFREAMSTSDFPQLFGDVLDRLLYASYLQVPIRWDRIARRGTVRDFRRVERFAIDGAETALDIVDELAPYPAAALSETPYEYRVRKRGRRVPMSWETWLNGDLGQFRDLPTRLANAARRTEEKFVTELFADANGPSATFFTAGNANVVTGNPALSITGLQTAFTVLGNQVDSGGEPIYIEGVTLVVPRSLEVVARNILNATEIMAASGGGDGTGNDQLRSANWMRDRVELVVDPWLPLVSSTANGATSWYLFANPNVGRPALELGFLIGHEQPEIWMKTPNAIRVGGGAVAPEEGSYENDGIEWRIRHVMGGAPVDAKMAVASNGTGVP